METQTKQAQVTTKEVAAAIVFDNSMLHQKGLWCELSEKCSGNGQMNRNTRSTDMFWYILHLLLKWHAFGTALRATS